MQAFVLKRIYTIDRIHSFSSIIIRTLVFYTLALSEVSDGYIERN